MAQEILMTEASLQALKEELEHHEVVGRQEIKEKIQVALSFGDLSENAEYDEARNDQAKLEATIAELKELIANAKIIDEAALRTDVVSNGSKVTIRLMDDSGTVGSEIFKYQIVNSKSSPSKDVGSNTILSDDSPVAKALIGHSVDDIVEVEAPRGIVKYQVVSISK